ncbi:hypothetical protein AK830_g6609 [Neonectria ditissima]|uniref:Uncharacterized protein n=1 Tax=Neonectria ditissima TaxID=78410 RepID=A0A0P7AQ56_9HYPO|nr:hypothetical protein AK830_g6609 [Neonectria ditissima]
MATLASIPDPNSCPARPKIDAPDEKRIPSFKRLRSRSRVRVLSRRPTRARHPRTGRSGIYSQHLPSNTAAPDHAPLENTKHSGSIAKGATHRKDTVLDRYEPNGTIPDLEASRNEHQGDAVPATGPAPFEVSPLSSKSLATPGSGNLDGANSVVDFNKQNGTTLVTSPKYSQNLPQLSHYCETTDSKKQTLGAACEVSSNNMSGVPDTPRRPGVDNRLVDAIARNVAQQLHMLSVTSEPRSYRRHFQDSEEMSPESYRNPSRTSSQRGALDRFTRELQRYAEHTGAKGKIPLFTPTPTRSGTTLRTVSALLPFRPEFTAAGLAVTSKDQAKLHSHRTRASANRATRQPPLPKLAAKQAHLSQLDGNDGCPSSNTEISFTTPNNMDEWRYAAMGKAVARERQKPLANRVPKSTCLPCIPGRRESAGWGCLQLLQKSQPQLYASESVTTPHHTVMDTKLKMSSFPAKASIPEWANLPAPNIFYPQPQQDTRMKADDVVNRAHRIKSGREHEHLTRVYIPKQPTTGLRRQPMVLP